MSIRFWRAAYYLCEACGNPIPDARRKIFPGVTLCVECQAYQERQRKHYA
ncbi:hypothetical protein JNQ24_004052 [Salmonella enterica subsp. enterica serovar Kentucky]|nr:hypothetical protein [Salmonella enterica subsp. enterica serovar Kentucky]